MASQIVTFVERRRRWPLAEKQRILAEALAPGSSVAAVADRNGVARSLLYVWLRLAREGRIDGVVPEATTPLGFLPVRISEAVPEEQPPELAQSSPPCVRAPKDATKDATKSTAPPDHRRIAPIEITLCNGRRITVAESVDTRALAAIAAALDGGTR